MLIAYEEPGTETIRAPVLKVFDGDGFKTMLWNTQLKKACEVVVRLGFTDAPELEQPGGKESKAFLTSLIADRWVELVVLLKMDTGRSFDRHGRIVCVPYSRRCANPCSGKIFGLWRISLPQGLSNPADGDQRKSNRRISSYMLTG